MDDDTLRYYGRNAEALASRYEAIASPLAPYFAVAFPAGARVLDVGVGSGRDLAALAAAGYDAWGVEPVEALAAAAVARHPELAGRIAAAMLPGLGQPFGGGFDGIVCSAVLMHVPRAALFDAAVALREALRVGGRLLVSLPAERADVAAGGRDAHGRLFEPYAPEEIALLFERLGFVQRARWVSADALARAGTRWATLLLERTAGSTTRPLDAIEAILNRDRKTATYKLALFRALAELATQEPRVATWHADGRVGVPIARLAERWLEYYWPIVAAERFIPQSIAEGAGTPQPLAFRAALAALIEPYRARGEHGGLAAWSLDRAGGRLPADTQARLAAALRSIAHAIRTGPVQHSGGALDAGPVFAFERGSRQVLMAAELWRELALLGHWIGEAVVLRWAALTARFGQRAGVTAAHVLPLLLARGTLARATGVARGVFERHRPLRCTWSDAPLVHRFDVDHVIPFALWGNNDLWNLVPAASAVNGDKSDRLPSAALLTASRPRVLAAWEQLREALPGPFDAQAATLLGRPVAGPLAWRNELFARLREAVELSALQRGVPRWEPRGALS